VRWSIVATSVSSVDLFDCGSGLDQRLAVKVELTGKRVEVCQRLGGLRVEDAQLVFQRLGRDAVSHGDVVHGGDEVGDAGDERAFKRIEVVVRAGQNFLQQDVAFAEPFEQGDGIGAQDLAGFLHLGHRRDRDLARLIDRRTRRLLQLLQRLVDRAGGEFPGGDDGTRHFIAVAQHSLREGLAARLDRPQCFRRDAVDIGREQVCLGADGLDEGAPPAVDHLRQAFGLLLHVADDFVGLAGHGGAEAAAGRQHRAFHFRRGRFDLRADLVGGGHQRLLRALCACRDPVRGVGRNRAERAFDICRDRPDLAGGIGGGRCQRTLRLARTGQDGGGGVRAGRGQCALHIGHQRLDMVGGFRGGGDKGGLGLACAGDDRTC